MGRHNNKLLRLCGVSPTGVMGSDIAKDAIAMGYLAEVSRAAADAMADELGQNRPALVTQVQPAGTSSKVLGEDGNEVQEGVHISPSRFVFDKAMLSEHDPLVTKARAAGYKAEQHSTQPTVVLVTPPVAFSDDEVESRPQAQRRARSGLRTACPSPRRHGRNAAQ